MSSIRRPRGALTSFLLLPSVLSMLGLGDGASGPPEAPIRPTPVEAQAPTRPSPFTKPGSPPPPAASATTAPVPVPSTPPEPTGSGDGTIPKVPAKPPTPPPSGLRPMTAPAATGPAIPIPTTKVTDWGSGTRGSKKPPKNAVYGGVLGTVLDSVTKKPVENVEVSIPELDLRALTGPDGLFMIRGIRVRPGAYELLMDAPSYQKKFGELKIEAKGTHKKEFELTPMGW